MTHVETRRATCLVRCQVPGLGECKRQAQKAQAQVLAFLSFAFFDNFLWPILMSLPLVGRGQEGLEMAREFKKTLREAQALRILAQRLAWSPRRLVSGLGVRKRPLSSPSRLVSGHFGETWGLQESPAPFGDLWVFLPLCKLNPLALHLFALA